MGCCVATCRCVVADDYHLEAERLNYRFALMMFLILCSVVGAPLSWHKTSGGDTVVWVGFELLHRTRHLGISLRGAEWFTKWTRETADLAVHPHGKVRGGAREDNVCGWSTRTGTALPRTIVQVHGFHPRQSTRRVPAYVSFILPSQDTTIARRPRKARQRRRGSMRKPVTRGPGLEDGSRDATAVDLLTS